MNIADLIRVDEALHKVQAAHYERIRSAAIAPAIKYAEDKLSTAFKAQGRAFLARFKALRGRFTEAISARDLGPLFDDPDAAAAIESAIAIATRMALQAGGDVRIADLKLDMSFSLKNPRAVEYIKAHGAELVAHIDETTRDYIQTVIDQGVDEGWSYDRMAKAITDRYDEFAVGRPQEHIDSRSHLIAVQESAMAYEHGNRIVVDDLMDGGLEMEKSWLTVGDAKVSDICLANEAEDWIPAQQDHASGAGEPPGHVACRCTELYRMKGSAYD